MRNEEQDVDEKSEKSDEQRWQQEDQQGQQIAGRMRRAMEMSSGCETETDESEECGDGMNDQDGRERSPSTRGKIKITAAGIGDIT